MVHHLITSLVVHHVARHATHQVVKHVARHAIHSAVNAAQTARHAQSGNTLQKVAQASTIIGSGKAVYELYTKGAHEYKKHKLREKIQILQEELENLENA
jgi:hypothetical protein